MARILSCDDEDLRAEAADAALLARRERSLAGSWDAPGEFLDAAHEDAWRAEVEAQAAADAAEEAEFRAEVAADLLAWERWRLEEGS